MLTEIPVDMLTEATPVNTITTLYMTHSLSYSHSALITNAQFSLLFANQSVSKSKFRP